MTAESKTSVTCTYKASDPSKSVIIQYLINVTPTEFTNQAKKVNSTHGPITQVKKLADAAYYFTVPSGSSTITTLVMIHGQAEIVITSTATLSQINSLAQLILYGFSQG